MLGVGGGLVEDGGSGFRVWRFPSFQLIQSHQAHKISHFSPPSFIWQRRGGDVVMLGNMKILGKTKTHDVIPCGTIVDFSQWNCVCVCWVISSRTSFAFLHKLQFRLKVHFRSSVQRVFSAKRKKRKWELLQPLCIKWGNFPSFCFNTDTFEARLTWLVYRSIGVYKPATLATKITYLFSLKWCKGLQAPKTPMNK